MKPFVPVRKYALMAAIFCASLFAVSAANATCVRNDTPKSLYVVMSSKVNKLEQTFIAGETVCISLAKGETAKVNVLPFSGARFGCRAELLRGETVGLDTFGTMNKCHFQRD